MSDGPPAISIHRILRTGMAVAAVALIAVRLSAAEPASQQPAPEIPVASLIDQLSSSDFSQRVQAQRTLNERLDESPDEVLQALDAASTEQGLRLIQLLESRFLQANDALAERIEFRLDDLSRSDSDLAKPALQVLDRNARLRTSRAQFAIEAMGGEIKFVRPTELEAYRSQATAAGTGVGFGEPAVPVVIFLYEDWKGGTEGLRQIRRLAWHPDLSLYSIRSNHVDEQALAKLPAVVPGLRVQYRGACLGIKSSSDTVECVVGEVIPNGPADKAGLEIFDHIVGLNGERILGFSNLVEKLTEFGVGDQLQLRIHRNGEFLTLPLVLQSWRELPSDQYAPPPKRFFGPLESEAASPEANPSTAAAAAPDETS